MSDLDHLRSHLQRLLRRNLAAVAAGDPSAVPRLSAVEAAFSPPRGRRSLPRIAQGVIAFRLDGTKATYPNLKYACYGIARPVDWEGRVLLTDDRLLDRLLTAVADLATQRRRFRECYRGLLTAWATEIIQPADEFEAELWEPGRLKLEQFLLAHRHRLAPSPTAPWIVPLFSSGLDDPETIRRELGATLP